MTTRFPLASTSGTTPDPARPGSWAPATRSKPSSTSGPTPVPRLLPLRLGEEVPGHPQNRRYRVRRTDAFARWLLSFGGDIVPVSPRELVDEYAGLVRETLAHHSASPPLRLSDSPPVRP